MDAVEPMLQAIAVLVWNLAKSYYPEKVEGALLKMILHKTEVVKDDAGGDLWFNKSCDSNRTATGIVHLHKPEGTRKQWYIYLGGGAVDECQSKLLMSAVVLAKDWTWAALTLVASWILLGCCPSEFPLLADPRLIRTEDVDGDPPVSGPEPVHASDSEGEDLCSNPVFSDQSKRQRQ